MLTNTKQHVVLGCLCLVGTLQRVIRQSHDLKKEYGRPQGQFVTKSASSDLGYEYYHDSSTMQQAASFIGLLQQQDQEELQQDPDDERVAALKNVSLRYFLYEDENLTLTSDLEESTHVLNAFFNHPLRTWNASQADLYIAPIDFMVGSTAQNHLALQTLISKPLFRKTSGHGHVFVALQGRLFDWSARGGTTGPGGVIKHFYAEQLENVTVAKDFDCLALRAAYRQLPYIWKKLVGGYRPVVSRMFSVGLLPRPIPFVHASYEKFQNAPIDIFYRTRSEPSFSGSTPFRHAPLLNITYSTNVSVGLGVNYEQWYRDMSSAKFCLAIRGDTPHTHALLHAVQVGCIPVVIANLMDLWAPTLKHSYILFV